MYEVELISEKGAVKPLIRAYEFPKQEFTTMRRTQSVAYGKLLGKIDSILYPWFYYPLPDTFCNSFFLFFFTAAVNRQLQNSRKLGSPLRYSSYEQHEDDMETDENGFAKQTPLDFGYYNQINNADVASDGVIIPEIPELS